MKNRLLLSMMLTGVMSISANAAEFGGKVYVNDATVAPGETAVLSIQMENDIDVSGFQLQMILPEGISYSSWSISEGRLPAGASRSDMITTQRFDEGKLTIAGVLNYNGSSFTQTSGELATVVITASPEMLSGIYTVEVQNVDVNDPAGTDYDVAPTTFTLTVGSPTGIETLQAEDEVIRIYDLQGRPQKALNRNQAGIVNRQIIYKK